MYFSKQSEEKRSVNMVRISLSKNTNAVRPTNRSLGQDRKRRRKDSKSVYLVFNLELADFGTSLPVPGSVATLSIRGNEIGIVDGTDSQIPKVLLIETDLLTRLCRKQPDLRLQFVDIITETRDNLLFLEMLDPGDFPTDLEPVKQRSRVDVPQMHPTVVTACQDIGCHNLEGRQLLVVVIERDHVLDMAPSPVLLPKEMTLAEELPVRDIGRERLGDIEIELALDDVQSESLPDELVRRCAIEQSTCLLSKRGN